MMTVVPAELKLQGVGTAGATRGYVVPGARSAVLDADDDARVAGGGASGVVRARRGRRAGYRRSPWSLPGRGVRFTSACSVSTRSTAGERRTERAILAE